MRAVLTGTYGVTSNASVRQQTEYYDSPVWSLWFEGLVLVRQNDEFALHERDGHWLGPVRARLAGIPTVPKFAQDLPESALRKELEKAIGFRALRRVAAVQRHCQSLDIRDEAGKTVARIALEEISGPARKPGRRFAHLSALRGYEAETSAAARLPAAACPEESTGPLEEALRLNDVQPKPYSTRPAVRLSPTQRTREVLGEVAIKTLAVARFNEAGIIDDVDTEHLHDFRVCLRKIRSVLTSIKDAYPAETLLAWKTTLGGLGRQTNRLRDLDVYLVSRPYLQKLLPSVLRPGLEPFFADLAAARQAEHRKVRAFFRQPAYREKALTLERELATCTALPSTEAAAVPIGIAAAERFARRFRRVAKLTRNLDDSSPDHAVHDIRIQCKKLRYLLEFFAPLFPADHVRPIARQLSKLQNRLGRFNDTSVQQSYLLAYGQENEKSGDTRLAMSLGGLIASLHNEHAVLRRTVRTTLEEFCCSENLTRIEQIRKAARKAPLSI